MNVTLLSTADFMVYDPLKQEIRIKRNKVHLMEPGETYNFKATLTDGKLSVDYVFILVSGNSTSSGTNVTVTNSTDVGFSNE